MHFVNCYQDVDRARAYARLEFANTYYLAYRDLPVMVAEHVTGNQALDFGCGTGRSSRFLQKLGFRVTGADISEDMLRIARLTDPSGDYRLVPGDDLSEFSPGAFDLVLCAFTFDNIPEVAKTPIIRDLADLLSPGGTLINLVSSPEIYTHEWASFSTRDFPEDVGCRDESYRGLYRSVCLEVIQMLEPIAAGDEPYPWVSETQIAPWVIYVLKRA